MLRCALLLVIPGLAAATPMTLGYQGRFLDSNGAPVNGSGALLVELHTSQGSEAAEWSEPFAGYPVEDGYVSVTLGAQATPLDSSLFAAESELWVAVSLNGTELLPRTRLVNVPYAVVAEEVTTPAAVALSPTSAPFGQPQVQSLPVSGFGGTRVATVVGSSAQLSVNGQAPLAAAAVRADDAVSVQYTPPSPGEHSVQVVVGETVFNWQMTATANNATCKTLLDSGTATSNGPQTIDPDGPGGAAPYTVWCDMAGGGWTYAAEGVPFALEYTGTPQSVTTPIVPAEYEFTLYGAAGGGKGYPAQNAVQHGAAGGMAKGRRVFDANTDLYVLVGGEGTPSDIQDNDGCQNLVGGYNGGGRATRGGASGGGATDLRLRIADLHSRLLVAGGGGGCGYGGIGCEFAGGVGGGLTGSPGVNGPSGHPGGGGGTQTAGGVVGSGGGAYANGSFGKGGDVFQCNDEGAGGGGWYGGAAGGAPNRTGGGGSSYYGGMDSAQDTAAGVQQRNGRALYIFR